MKFQTMIVTPEMAKQFLLKNTGNRPIKRCFVDEYKRAFASGDWHLTHQAIAFASDGTLLDGQHRLTAIAEGEIAVMLVVSMDVPETARLGMDIGKPRDWVDQMGFNGTERPDTRESRAASSMIRGMKRATRYSKGDVRAFFLRHIDAIKFATSIHTTRKNGLRVSQVPAVIARARYHVEDDILIAFCDELQTGNGANNMVFGLRDWMLSEAQRRGGMAATQQVYRKVARVVDAYRRGQTLKHIYEATTEPFPLPEELEASKTPRLKVA